MSAADEAAVPRRAGKRASAFRTIGEVAENLDLPAHVLRFWESKFPQLKPLKRGGGRRYYRPEDVLLLQRIRRCLYHDGYTIRGVQRLLNDGGAELVPALASATARAPTTAPAPTPDGMATLFPLEPLSPSAPQPQPAKQTRRPVPAGLPSATRKALEQIRRDLLAIKELAGRLAPGNDRC
ncbi:MAG TPA: MerR family transcriptional regulator [Stellaceae bacterium]|nr:MerR family transcriptional regulator [Stellaceae bacterium]